MAPTVTEDLELIITGHGGSPTPPSGGGDGDRPGGNRRVPQSAYFTLVQLLLAAIVMFFMALTSSYIVRKGLGTDWQQTPIPPILWFNTVILLGSSLTIHLARRERAAFRQWWSMTILLGLVFLGGQLIAWRQLAAAGMFLDTNPSSSFFYVLTAAHGLHLAGGIFALFYVFFRNWGRSRITQETAANLAAIYWHFMDGLWLFLLALLTLGR